MTGKGCKDLTKLEKGILELLQKHMAKIGFFTLLFFSMLLRWVLLPYGSNDFLDFLRPWYEEIRASGGMTALKNEIGACGILVHPEPHDCRKTALLTV